MTLTLTAPKPSAATPPVQLGQVQVWFGPHKIVDWEGPAEDAPSIAAGLQRRYAGLKVRKADGSDW